MKSNARTQHPVTANKTNLILLLVLLGSLTACSPGSNSPAQAIKNYYEATSDNSRRNLERFWWIDEQETIRDAIIDNRLIMAEYNKTLERKAEKGLAELEKAGRVSRRPSDPIVPEMREIERAVESALKRGDSQRLSVFISGQRTLSVGMHNGKWYVEHPHVSAGRKWKDKDIGFYSEMNGLYKGATADLRSGKAMVSGPLMLRLFLGGIQSDQSKIMRKYDVPLLVM